MASQPKILPTFGRRVPPVTKCVSQIASLPAFFEAQRWFSRERPWTNDRHLQLCRIPAPTFFEQKRAEWFRDQIKSIGWEAWLDRAGNVLARFGGATEDSLLLLALTAHLDTVLAPGRPEDITVGSNGIISGPGVSDNGSGLSALLTLARVLAETPDLHWLARSILLVANVGEEGEGNLSGMRYLCSQRPLLERIAAFVVLDGPSVEHITAQALASRRFEISFGGPGGHSWNDHGTPNPINSLAGVITAFGQAADLRIAAANLTRCSYNFGIVEGGTGINSIPAHARAKLDLRSEESALLDDLSSTLTLAVERALEQHNRTARSGRLTAKIKELGSRPAGRLAPDALLLHAVQAVDAHLSIRSRVDCASTDANIPLSLGSPAVSIGTGGQGAGAHTAQEWFQPEGRELGLHRILLLLATLHGSLVSPPSKAGQSAAGA